MSVMFNFMDAYLVSAACSCRAQSVRIDVRDRRPSCFARWPPVSNIKHKLG